jgi:hypothetical protein
MIAFPEFSGNFENLRTQEIITDLCQENLIYFEIHHTKGILLCLSQRNIQI